MSGKVSLPGMDFQGFVAFLEELLCGRSGAVVESPKRLRDRDTGRMREHDIVITWPLEHHQIMTAVECKDTSRKIGVPDVEAFSKKCEKTGVHHPVIVASSGFTKSALTKASTLGITTMRFSQVKEHDWEKFKRLTTVVRMSRRRMHFSTNIVVPGFGGQTREVRDPEGKLFTPEDFQGLWEAGWEAAQQHELFEPSLKEGFENGEYAVNYRLESKGWYIIDSDGNRREIEDLWVEGSWKISKFESTGDLRSYSGPFKSHLVSTNDVDWEGIAARFVTIVGEDGETQIAVEPGSAGEGKRLVVVPHEDGFAFVEIDEADYEEGGREWREFMVRLIEEDEPVRDEQ